MFLGAVEIFFGQRWLSPSRKKWPVHLRTEQNGPRLNNAIFLTEVITNTDSLTTVQVHKCYTNNIDEKMWCIFLEIVQK